MSTRASDAPSTGSTLDDVALRAGVSSATASRVLNGSVRVVSEPLRQRVESAARALDYAPHRAAQATARGTAEVVCLLVADIADPYFGHLAAGVSRAAQERGLLLSVAVTGDDADRELAQLAALRGQRPRAVILGASRVGETLPGPLAREIARVQAGGTRVVAVGPGAGDLASVAVDNTGGAWALGRSLGRLGYQRAIVLAGDEGVRTSDDRLAGFVAGFDTTGGKIVRVAHGAIAREAGRAHVRHAAREGLLARGTLVFAVSDVIALGAMAAARELGRAVGTDLAFAGFDDIPAASDCSPGLTTVKVPLDRLGYLTVATACDDGSESARPLPVEVVLRASTPGPS